jgi:MoxR-like ATPase
MLQGQDRREILRAMPPVLSWTELEQMQAWTRLVHVSQPLLDYLLDLLAASRVHGRGLSPRAGLALLAASRAWALMHGRAMVLPEDLRAVGPSVIGHRLEHAHEGVTGVDFAERLLSETPVP